MVRTIKKSSSNHLFYENGTFDVDIANKKDQIRKIVDFLL